MLVPLLLCKGGSIPVGGAGPPRGPQPAGGDRHLAQWPLAINS